MRGRGSDDEVVGEDLDPSVVMWEDNVDLAKQYLDSWYSIKDAANELWIDEKELEDEYGDEYE